MAGKGERAPNAGFTLVEAVCAIAISAFTLASAYRALDTLSTTYAIVDEENRKWRDAAMFFDHVENGLKAMASISASGMDDAFVKEADHAGGGTALSFIRRGSQFDGQSQLITSRLVEYRLNDGTVELALYPAPIPAPQSVPQTYPLISGIKSLSIVFIGQDGQNEKWSGKANPRAVKIHLTLKSGEEFYRLMEIR